MWVLIISSRQAYLFNKRGEASDFKEKLLCNLVEHMVSPNKTDTLKLKHTFKIIKVCDLRDTEA